MSARGNRLLFGILLLLIAALMFALNVHTPLMMDDYDYSFSWSTGERLAGIGDILVSQAAHYKLWGGRSVTHFFAQLFLYLGKPVFNLANALMYVLLLLEIYQLSKRRDTAWDWRAILTAHLILFAAVEFFGVAFLWLDGACNYLWGTVLALLPLLIARSEREGGCFACDGLRAWFTVPLCFLCGWTNENTACGVLAALLLVLVWDVIKKRRIRLWRVCALCAQALGVAVLLLAPGNFARTSEPASRSFVMEMVYRAAVVTYCLLRYAGTALVLAAAAGLWAYRKKAVLRLEWLCILGGGAFLSAYALVGSPQISDRSFTAVIVLAIALLAAALADMKPHADRRSLYMGAALALLAIVIGLHALGEVKRHESAWHTQFGRIERAQAQGEDMVSVSSVVSASRYTMDIVLDSDPGAWPNSTLGKYFGVRIAGE